MFNENHPLPSPQHAEPFRLGNTVRFGGVVSGVSAAGVTVEVSGVRILLPASCLRGEPEVGGEIWATGTVLALSHAGAHPGAHVAIDGPLGSRGLVAILPAAALSAIPPSEVVMLSKL